MKKYFLKIKKYIGLLKLVNFPNYDNITEKKIVFHTVRNDYLVLAVEMYLARVLSQLGASVYMIFDDGVLEHWDTSQDYEFIPFDNLNPSKNRHSFKNIFIKFLVEIISFRKLHIIYYSKILNSNQINSDEIKHNYHIHNEYAESSVKRYFQLGNINLKYPKQKNYYDLSIINCIKSHAVGKYINDVLKPDCFITSHGIYSVWGPCYRYIKDNGSIEKIIIYGSHPYSLKQIVFQDIPHQLPVYSEEFYLFFKKELADQKKEKVKNYFKLRFQGNVDDTKIYFQGKNKEIKYEKSANPTYCLFPNIIWDGDISERNIMYEGVLDWLLDTIDYVKGNNSITLFIRFHPAETTLHKNSVSLEKLLREHRTNIDSYENIILLSSDSKINSYKFIKEVIDVGVVYGGILGLEMNYLGVPAISVSQTRYEGESFTLMPKTKDEYYNLLSNYKAIKQQYDENKIQVYENVLKSAYWYLFIRGNYFPIYCNQRNKINFKNHHTFNLSESSPFYPTIKKILQ